jgi:hypothetical protein
MGEEKIPRQMAHVYWAQELLDNTMAVVCAVIRTDTGSLDTAPGVLEWSYFSPSPRSFTHAEWEELSGDPTAKLELWVQRNAARIEKARASVFFAAAVRGQLMEETHIEGNPEEA